MLIVKIAFEYLKTEMLTTETRLKQFLLKNLHETHFFPNVPKPVPCTYIYHFVLYAYTRTSFLYGGLGRFKMIYLVRVSIWFVFFCVYSLANIVFLFSYPTRAHVRGCRRRFLFIVIVLYCRQLWR